MEKLFSIMSLKIHYHSKLCFQKWANICRRIEQQAIYWYEWNKTLYTYKDVQSHIFFYGKQNIDLSDGI